MSVFGQAKDMYKLRSQAKKLQKALSEELVEVEADGGNVVIKMTADQKLKGIELKYTEMPSDLGETLVKALNKANEAVQKIAAEKMRAMGGLPGLGM